MCGVWLRVCGGLLTTSPGHATVSACCCCLFCLQLQMRVSATFVKDVLAGDGSNEIRLQLQGRMDEEAGDEYKDD